MHRLTWHGHSTFELVLDDGTRILIDAFLDENPKSTVGAEHFHDRLDYLLLTHGHFDHVMDAWGILAATDATLVSSFEICSYAGNVRGHEYAHGMSVGGAHDFPFGRVKLTPAIHGGRLDAEGGESYTCPPSGFLITLEDGGTRLYFAGDTALTTDFQLLENHVDIAVLPIGDNFTMGPEDAARAAEMIKPRVVIPCHYDTMPVIEQDTEAFRALVEPRSDVIVLASGEAHEFD